MDATIFYSWQSDLPNRTNRSLIERALEAAAKRLTADASIEAAPRLDKDTQGEPGAPDIAATILRKISEATAAVFDISIVLRHDNRSSPNPNVLLELGYAMHALSPERVILLFNTAYGMPEELPFDLRLKRVQMYEAAEATENLTATRDQVAKVVEAALRAIFQRIEEGKGNVDSEETIDTYYFLFNNLLAITTSEREYKDRRLKPEIDTQRSNWHSTAEQLRELARTDVLLRDGIEAELLPMADQLDELATHHVSMRGGPDPLLEILQPVAQAAEALAWERCAPIAKQRYRPEELEQLRREAVRSAVGEFDRLARAVEEKESRHIPRMRENLSRVGSHLLSTVAYPLKALGAEGASDLIEAGLVLDVADIKKSNEVGFREVGELIERLSPLIEKIREKIEPSHISSFTRR